MKLVGFLALFLVALRILDAFTLVALAVSLQLVTFQVAAWEALPSKSAYSTTRS